MKEPVKQNDKSFEEEFEKSFTGVVLGIITILSVSALAFYLLYRITVNLINCF